MNTQQQRTSAAFILGGLVAGVAGGCAFAMSEPGWLLIAVIYWLAFIAYQLWQFSAAWCVATYGANTTITVGCAPSDALEAFQAAQRFAAQHKRAFGVE